MAFGLTAPARSLLNSYGLERGVLLGILNRYYELAPRYVSSDILKTCRAYASTLALLALSD